MTHKLLNQKRDTLLTTELVSNRVLNSNLRELSSILKNNLDGVSNGTLLGVMVVDGVGLVLNTSHLLTEGVDTGVGSDGVVVVGSGETTEDQGDGNHVLDTVVTVGVVVKRTLLVDDSDGSLLGTDGNLGDVIGGLSGSLKLGVEGHGGLTGSLGVELGGERDLEQNILHDVRSERTLELELVALEKDIVETPDLGGQDRGDSLDSSVLDHKGQVNGARTGISGGPGLTGHGVGCVTVRTEGLSVNPSLGDSVGGLLTGETEELGDNGGGGDLDEDDVVKSNAVEGVLESESSLDLVSLDHGLKNILDGGDGLSGSLVGTGQPVGNGQDTSQVVGGVTPLSGQPTVVVVEPSDGGSDVESSTDGVELVGGSGDLGSVGNDGS